MAESRAKLRVLLVVGAILLIGASMAFGGRTRPVNPVDHSIQAQTSIHIRAPLPLAEAAMK
jgi:hypothetical protein